MKRVFYNTEFKGHWPVGTAAIVIAEKQEDAANILMDMLKEIGLPQDIEKETMVEMRSFVGNCVILNDGNY